MKRKIIFIATTIFIGILSFLDLSGSNYIELLTIPFQLVGLVLRNISLQNEFLNFLSTLLYIGIILIPIYLLIRSIKKKTVHLLDYIFLPIITIVLAITLLFYVNPHSIYMQMNDFAQEMFINDYQEVTMILNSGIAFCFFLIVLIYITTKAFALEKYDSISIFKLLIDVVIVAFIFNVLVLSLSNVKEAAAVPMENTLNWINFIGDVIITLITIYVLDLFRTTIIQLEKDGFNKIILKPIQRMYLVSFILLLTALGFQLLTNVIQLLALSKFDNIHFSLDLPIFTLILVSIIFILTKYIKKVLVLKQEHEMII